MVSNNDQSFSRPLSAGSAVSMAKILWVPQWMEPRATMGFVWILLKPLGRAGPMAKLELESGLLWQRMDCWSLGKIYSIKLLSSSSGASAATFNSDARAWHNSCCWRPCPSSLWISSCSRTSTASAEDAARDCWGVLRDQRPTALQAHLQWWDGRVWVVVDVSHLVPWFYAYRKVWPIGWKLTYGHSVQSKCTHFQTWNSNLINLKSFPNCFIKTLTPASDPLHLLRVYIAVYISLIQ